MSDLRAKRLFVASQGPAGRVMCFQDGTDAAPEATAGYRFDRAFSGGAQRPTTAGAQRREYVDLLNLDHDYEEGKVYRFRVLGDRAGLDNSEGALRINPNDRVRFEAERPLTNSAVGTVGWHLNSGAPGGVRVLFRGFVELVEPTDDGGLTVTCRDGLWKAQDVLVVRERPAIPVPKLAFNLSEDHADFWWAPKKKTGVSGLVKGETDLKDNRATVAEILSFLMEEYADALVDEDILLPGVDLFHASDLAVLTMKPGPLVFENLGLAAAVREVLAWAPDRKLVVDHQTGQWRILPWGPLLGTGGTTLSQQALYSGQPYKSALRIPFGAHTSFSATAGADGNRLRIYEASEPSVHEEATVHSIATVSVLGLGTVHELRLYETLKRANYAVGSRIAPVLATALPTLRQSIDGARAGSVRLAKDLRDAYSSVAIYSVHQKTETVTKSWRKGGGGAQPLRPAWNPTFESVWRDRDSERTQDNGTAANEGRGLKVHGVTTVGLHDALLIKYEQSAFAADHAPDEWAGCSLWVQTRNAVDVTGLNESYTVVGTTHVADVGDGQPGLRVELLLTAGYFLATAFNLQGAGSPDFVKLSQDFRFATTTKQNGRNRVGRDWYFHEDDDDATTNATTGPHVSTCRPVKVTVDDGLGNTKHARAVEPRDGLPGLDWKPNGNFEYVGGGPAGSTLIWRRRAVSVDKPAGSACPGGVGYQ